MKIYILWCCPRRQAPTFPLILYIFSSFHEPSNSCTSLPIFSAHLRLGLPIALFPVINLNSKWSFILSVANTCPAIYLTYWAHQARAPKAAIAALHPFTVLLLWRSLKSQTLTSQLILSTHWLLGLPIVLFCEGWFFRWLWKICLWCSSLKSWVSLGYDVIGHTNH